MKHLLNTARICQVLAGYLLAVVMATKSGPGLPPSPRYLGETPWVSEFAKNMEAGFHYNLFSFCVLHLLTPALHFVCKCDPGCSLVRTLALHNVSKILCISARDSKTGWAWMQCVYAWYLLKVINKQRNPMHFAYLKVLKSRQFHIK